MKFNPNPLEFFKNRGEQSALKSFIQEKVKNFEENLSYAKIDHKKPPFEMYRGINSDQLSSLIRAVNAFGSYMRDIKKNNELSKDVGEIFDEIEKTTNRFLEISKLDEMEKIFNKSDIRRYSDDKNIKPYVIEPMASQITTCMQNLWIQIHKLKSLNFDSIFSSKLSADK